MHFAMQEEAVDDQPSGVAATPDGFGTSELTQLSAPIASPLGTELTDLMASVTPLETSVNLLVQRLHQVCCNQYVLPCSYQDLALHHEGMNKLIVLAFSMRMLAANRPHQPDDL